METSQEREGRETVSFSHVHLYVDEVHDIQEYKALEGYLNELAQVVTQEHGGKFPAVLDVKRYRKVWLSILRNNNESIDKETEEDDDNDMSFISQNRDVIRQLISGFGFRITATRCRNQQLDQGALNINTRSVLLSSSDPEGVQVIVTASDPSIEGQATGSEEYRHFDACTRTLLARNLYLCPKCVSCNSSLTSEKFSGLSPSKPT